MTDRLDALSRALATTAGEYVHAAIDREVADAGLRRAQQEYDRASAAFFAARDAMRDYAESLEAPRD